MNRVRRYKIVLDYDGTGYHGWQRQESHDVRIIQGELEDILAKITGEEVQIVGCGRTDAGVHARGYVAHFGLERSKDTTDLTYKLNRMTSPQIAVDKAYAESKLANSELLKLREA